MGRGGARQDDDDRDAGVDGVSGEAGDAARAARPFQCLSTKDGKVFITWGGKMVAVLRGKDAAAFLDRARGASADEQQQLMARVTGNFKRGNERKH